MRGRIHAGGVVRAAGDIMSTITTFEYNIFTFPKMYEKIFNTPLNIFNMFRIDLESKLLCDSHNNPFKFRQEIDNIKVSLINPIVLIRPH